MEFKGKTEDIEANLAIAVRKTEAFMTMNYTIRAGPLTLSAALGRAPCSRSSLHTSVCPSAAGQERAGHSS